MAEPAALSPFEEADASDAGAPARTGGGAAGGGGGGRRWWRRRRGGGGGGAAATSERRASSCSSRRIPTTCCCPARWSAVRRSNRAAGRRRPARQGHVVMFAIRPFWRWQTQGTFFLGFNAILNWSVRLFEARTRSAPARRRLRPASRLPSSRGTIAAKHRPRPAFSPYARRVRARGLRRVGAGRRIPGAAARWKWRLTPRPPRRLRATAGRDAALARPGGRARPGRRARERDRRRTSRARARGNMSRCRC